MKTPAKKPVGPGKQGIAIIIMPGGMKPAAPKPRGVKMNTLPKKGK